MTTYPGPAMRLFAAINLSPEMQSECSRLQAQLSRRFEGVRWTQPEKLHLTLKFLGEVPEDEVGRIEQELEQAAALAQPFTAALGQGGSFPQKGPPRILWINFSAGSEELVNTARLCEEKLAPLGFPPEKRPFSPHITLGRVKENVSKSLRGALESLQVSALAERVEQIDLMRSVLSPQGSSYSVLKSFKFASSP